MVVTQGHVVRLLAVPVQAALLHAVTDERAVVILNLLSGLDQYRVESRESGRLFQRRDGPGRGLAAAGAEGRVAPVILRAMGRVLVEVMPKREVLDPQGQAVAAALPRLGLAGFTAVRQGKRFELEVEGEVTPAVLEAARRAAQVLLSNTVLEDVVLVGSAEDESPVTDQREVRY